MEKYKVYRVIHRGGYQRINRESVMMYLGEDEWHYIFSARPVAGTQTMPKSWVISTEMVPENTPPYVNRKVYQ